MEGWVQRFPRRKEKKYWLTISHAVLWAVWGEGTVDSFKGIWHSQCSSSDGSSSLHRRLANDQWDAEFCGLASSSVKLFSSL